MAQQSETFSLQKGNIEIEEQEHVTVARALQKFRLKAKMTNIPFPIKFPTPKPKLATTQSPQSSTTTSKILPLIHPKTTKTRAHKFPAAEAPPYVPVGRFMAHCRIAPPVTIRNAIPVFSALPPRMGVAPPPPPPNQLFPVTIRRTVIEDVVKPLKEEERS